MSTMSEGGTTTVVFVCQRCDQPLKLGLDHEALEHLLLDKQSQAAVQAGEADAAAGGGVGATTASGTEGEGADGASEIAAPGDDAGAGAPAVSPEAATSAAAPPLPTPLHSARTIPNPTDEAAAAAAVAAAAAAAAAPKLSSHYHVMQAAGKLFDLSSATTDTDHPLCEECTDCLLDELDLRLREVEGENKASSEFLEKFAADADAEGGVAALQAAEAELVKVQAEEVELLQSLENIAEEKLKVSAAREKQQAVSDALDKEEEQYWMEYHEYERSLQEFHSEQHGVEHQYQQAYEHLEKLKKTNVFNDAFHIWHDGHFGTINGYRLGRLPSVPVEWNEINAAWGQTVLLLHTMASKLKYRFTRYRLVPNGSHSRLEKANDAGTPLQLSSSGGFKLFSDSKFDAAMVAFLDCLQQFKTHVESQDQHFKLPYRIHKDKIGDSHGEHSIKFQGNHEETWTKALKFMLTNLKWCLAWVCKQVR